MGKIINAFIQTFKEDEKTHRFLLSADSLTGLTTEQREAGEAQPERNQNTEEKEEETEREEDRRKKGGKVRVRESESDSSGEKKKKREREREKRIMDSHHSELQAGMEEENEHDSSSSSTGKTTTADFNRPYRRFRLYRYFAFAKTVCLMCLVVATLFNPIVRVLFLGEMMINEIYISPYPQNTTLNVSPSDSGLNSNSPGDDPRASPVVMPMLNNTTLPPLLPSFEFSLCGTGTDSNSSLYCPNGYQCLLVESLCFVNLTEASSSSFNAPQGQPSIRAQNIGLCQELLSAQDIVTNQQGQAILGIYRLRGAAVTMAAILLAGCNSQRFQTRYECYYIFGDRRRKAQKRRSTDV